jgi:hypothetical protein
MADFNDITSPESYTDKWVAFTVTGETATVLQSANTLGDIKDNATGQVLQKGLLTLCSEADQSEYLIHKF